MTKEPASILIIDDDIFFTEDLKELLEMRGYNSNVIHEAKQAKDELESTKRTYSLIILDMMLRASGLDVSGFSDTGELLYSLAKKRNYGEKIVVISAKNQSDINIDFDSDEVLFIRKPLTVENVRELIEIAQG